MRRVGILMYHRVEYLDDDYNMQAVTPANFAKHMKYLREHYDVLSLDAPMESWFEGKADAVIITFDDGYYDFLYNVVPIMETYDIPATVFVSTANIDSTHENWTDSILRALFSNERQRDSFTFETEYYSGKFPTGNWAEKYALYQKTRKLFLVAAADRRKQYEEWLLEWAGLTKDGRENRRIMTSEELRDVAARKGISIGAHTVTHCSLRQQTFSEQRYEIMESKRTLEEIIGQEVKLFAYPFGTKDNYSDVTIDLLKEAGYEKAVVAYSGDLSKSANMYELNRFPVKNYDESDFINYIEQVVFPDNKVVYGEDNISVSTGKAINYMGKMQNDDIISSDNLLVIWGTGYWGKKLYFSLKELGIAGRIVAFGDNDEEKAGGVLENIPILDLKAVENMQRDNHCHILVKGDFDFEICKELLKKRIYNIHLFT